jgi:malonate-semialdehyde dehydrogenase (acetylating)/methylmalonate-semialdehyde dehydrogenase
MKRSNSPRFPLWQCELNLPRSGEAARAYRYGIEAAMIGVNVGVPAPVAWFPYVGWMDSCDADLHANGPDAIDFYTRKKVVTARWS